MAHLPPDVHILWTAFLLDLFIPEPPNAAHPVAWMGMAIGALRDRAPKHGRWKPLMAGAAIVLVGGALCAVVGLWLHAGFRKLPPPFSILAEALVLKLMFSARSLVNAGEAVRRALESGELEAARRLVGWHLVSRDTSRLDDSQVAAAAIESLAENANDSIVAPLLFYAIAGLPGVLAYRFINTCDAMLGYRDLKREWLGKCSARVDDLANLVPARLTAALIILAGVPLGGSVPRAVRTWFRDSRVTASPNAGHPMSAAAGVLGVELTKCGHYRLGTGERLPAARDIARARRLVWSTTLLAMLGISVIRIIM
ncbi:MAG: adenosylcobinamide-phosphate synthase CbiB [Isosphaeraceae bacterium]|jgi:adenosylcobinamide-phosphate synthase